MRRTAADAFAVSPGAVPESASPEDTFMAAVPLSQRRLRGQFFTPASIANLMAEWVCAKNPRRVLDPAMGTGVLVRAVAAHMTESVGAFTAFEIDPSAATLARAGGPWHLDLRIADYLQDASAETFDAVIANPPYVRHHDVNHTTDVMGALSARTGIVFSRLSNIYVPFVVKCFEALADGGRAAVIVPTEWANANFGAGLKAFLEKYDALREVIYFSHAGLVFAGNLSTACILLMEKSRRRAKPVHGWFVGGRAEGDVDTSSLGALRNDPRVTARLFTSDELYGARKWNHLFERGTGAVHPGLVPLSELASTKRGLATGANGFFHLSRAAALNAGIDESNLLPCVGKAGDVGGVMFTAEDFAALEARGKRTRLVDLRGSLSAREAVYVRGGQAAGLPERYLLRARAPWYIQERRDPAPIWAAVFGRTSMRFVLNTAKVQSLTTFHGIYPKDTRAGFSKALCACLNSGFVQIQSEAQRRVYGGGLLKFEPGDLLQIYVPDLRRVSAGTLDNLCAAFDALVVEGTPHTREVLNTGAMDAASEVAN